MASIYVLKGDGKGKQYELAAGSNILGRNRLCNIRFNDIEMSRKHLDLELSPEGLFASDLNSANGSHLNGSRLIKRRRVRSGDRIMLGQVQLLINLKSAVMPLSENIADGSSASHSSDVLDDDSLEDSFQTVKNNFDFLYHALVTACSSTETDGMFETLLQLVFKWVNVDRGSVLLWDEATSQFIPRISKRRNFVKAGPIQFSRTIIEYVAEHRKGILTGHAGSDDRWAPKGSILMDGIEEVICVPIRGRAENYGLIYVDTVANDEAEDVLSGQIAPVENRQGAWRANSGNAADSGRLNNDHLKLLVMIAHQAAIVIENREFNSAVVHSEHLAAVGQTLSAMSHHIKNIMQSINCGEHLVDEGLNSQQSDTVRQGWNIVQRNQKEMTQLVMDMLALSRKSPPHLNTGDPGKCVVRACEETRPLLCEKKIVLNFEPPGLEMSARIESELITRAVAGVIQFYLHSAPSAPDDISAGGNGKANSVSDSQTNDRDIGISLHDDDTNVTIVIRDNFLSLPEQEIAGLFNLLAYANDQAVRGISLPVCHKILEEHGGSATVTSTGEKGLEFRLQLPGVSPPSEQKTGYFRRNNGLAD